MEVIKAYDLGRGHARVRHKIWGELTRYRIKLVYQDLIA